MKVVIPDSISGNLELEIFPLVYREFFVVTTKQLSMLYGCSSQNITVNFRAHEKNFIDGVDYFLLIGEDLRAFKKQIRQETHEGNQAGRNLSSYLHGANIVPSSASMMFLWTESGARKHAEFLTGNRAKIIFSAIALGYFRADEPAKNPSPPKQPSLFADEPRTVEISVKAPSTVETTPCDTRIELLMELIRMIEGDNQLRNTLIRKAASLILGEQI